MIDDLFTDLTVNAVEHLLSIEVPRDEADFGLAQLNARLSVPIRPETKGGFASEAHFVHGYLELAVDDLQQISPRVHEWVLERFSVAFVQGEHGLEALRVLYFLFPESTLRSAVVGLLVEADHPERPQWAVGKPPIALISEAIDEDTALSGTDRINQSRTLVDLLLDYVDTFPDATGRALATVYQSSHRDESLERHLVVWAERFGGEAADQIWRVLGSPGSRE